MADKTGIEWTDATWNPLVGCTHVSAGCDNCYAAREASTRLATNPTYRGLAIDGKFTGEVRMLTDRLDEPLRWRRPRKVFVNSMSDLFHDVVPDTFIAAVFAVMSLADQHKFQVLTKRPGRMASLLKSDEFWMLVQNARVMAGLQHKKSTMKPMQWPLPNVWLGTSVEDQKWANVRVPKLLDTPAAVRFLSMEPLLGPVDLAESYRAAVDSGVQDPAAEMALHWVIVGGESNLPREEARAMHPDWVRSIRDQCAARPTPIPFLFKQWGEWSPKDNYVRHIVVEANGDRHARFGEPYEVIEARGGVVMSLLGKKAAGRELDGVTHDGYPE